MQATLIENSDNGRIAYDSLILSDPKALSVLNSKIAMKIVKSLAETPCCAIDVARKLKIHEQKIYYHLRNLEKAGIVYIISQEKRHGMIAKIYSVVSPVVATKLFDRGVEVKENINSNVSKEVLDFLYPFIKEGNLNAKIIIGDPYPHGEWDMGATDGPHIADLILFLGSFLTNLKFPCYKLDTETREEDLKDNLILFGNPKSNLIINKINEQVKLPVFFDSTNGFSIHSTITKKTYDDSRVGILMKIENPFDKEKYVLILGGIKSRGVKAAVIAATQYIDYLVTEAKKNGEVIKVVQGLDKDGDSIIDKIKFLE